MGFGKDRVVFEDNLCLINWVLLVEQRTIFDLIPTDQFSILILVGCDFLELHRGETTFGWTAPKCVITKEVCQLLLVLHRS